MRWMIWSIISSVVAMASFLVASDHGSNNGTALLLMTIAAFFFCLIILRGVDSIGGCATAVFGFYMMVLLTFPGMLHAARGFFPFFGRVYASSDVTWVALLLLLFAISSLAGVWLAAKRYPQRECSELAIEVTVVRPVVIVAGLGVALALVAILGPDTFIRRRSDVLLSGALEMSESSIALVTFARAHAFILLLAASHRFLMAGRRAPDAALLLVCFCVTMVITYPLAIPRFMLFGNVIIASHLVLNVASRKFKAMLVSGLLLMTGTVFPLMSHLQRGDERVSYEINVIEYFADSGDLDGFQSMINVSMLAEGTGFRWGWQLLSAVLAPVPRSLWPAKGGPTGAEAAAYAGYPFTNISSPLPSELYIDFGWPAIILGGFLVGYFVSALDLVYVTFRRRRDLRVILLIGGVSGYLTVLLRGALLGIVAPLAAYFLISVLITLPPCVTVVRRAARAMQSRERARRLTGSSLLDKVNSR